MRTRLLARPCLVHAYLQLEVELDLLGSRQPAFALQPRACMHICAREEEQGNCSCCGLLLQQAMAASTCQLTSVTLQQPGSSGGATAQPARQTRVFAAGLQVEQDLVVALAACTCAAAAAHLQAAVIGELLRPLAPALAALQASADAPWARSGGGGGGLCCVQG